MTDLKQAAGPPGLPPSYETATHPPIDSKSSKPPPARPLFPLEIPAISAIKGRRVILASASPRRKLLLAQIGITKFEIIPSTLPENLSKSLSPFEYVLQTATQKALDVYTTQASVEGRDHPSLLLAADTIVVSKQGHILEKPRSEAEHIAMLTSLRDGGAHKVFTAVAAIAPLESAIYPGYAMQTAVEETTVYFAQDLTDELILAYVKTREGADKAGGYGIQGIGAILVEKIEGSFDNVVGLPLRATLGVIQKVLEQSAEVETEGSSADEEI